MILYPKNGVLLISEALYLTKGEQCASRGLSKFIVPDSRTARPGKNFRLLGFGVSCVCTNIVLPGETKQSEQKSNIKTYQLISLE